jgi:glycosyltransferase involved in cell wall biosynthesis
VQRVRTLPERPPVIVIAALSRPERVPDVMGAFFRQDYSGTRHLLMVENGRAIGSVPAADGVSVIRSPASSGEARNHGLAWARGVGGAAWAFFDDDDYYGPGYLTEQISALTTTGANVVGKAWQYVMYPDGLYRIQSPRENCWDEIGLTGGSLCGLSPFGLPEFEVRSDDDLAWCSAVRSAGMRTWATSRYNYCYDRSRPGPRVQVDGPAISRRAMSGDGVCSDYFGLVPHSVVDDRLAVPVRSVPPPTSAEILEDLRSFSPPPSPRLS